jgi:hypothetical protein
MQSNVSEDSPSESIYQIPSINTLNAMDNECSNTFEKVAFPSYDDAKLTSNSSDDDDNREASTDSGENKSHSMYEIDQEGNSRVDNWLKTEGVQKFRNSLDKLRLNLNTIYRINLNKLTSFELQSEKEEVGKEIKAYEREFKKVFRYEPGSREMTPMAPLYTYFKRLERYIKTKNEADKYINKFIIAKNEPINIDHTLSKTFVRQARPKKMSDSDMTIKKTNRRTVLEMQINKIYGASSAELKTITVKKTPEMHTSSSLLQYSTDMKPANVREIVSANKRKSAKSLNLLL